KNLLEYHPIKNAANLAQSHVRKECVALDSNNEPYVRPELFKPLRGNFPIPQNAKMKLLDDQLMITWTLPKDDSQNWIKLNVVLLNMEEEADIRVSIAPAITGESLLKSALLSRRGNGVHVYIGFQ